MKQDRIYAYIIPKIIIKIRENDELMKQISVSKEGEHSTINGKNLGLERRKNSSLKTKKTTGKNITSTKKLIILVKILTE